jgi:predicted PurR-regulated permease PerM
LNGELMSPGRSIVFWMAVLVVPIAVVVLLRDVLLPFVAGAVLAYLLNPLATRIERLGVDRLIATLIIIGLTLIIFVVLLVLALPVVARELAHFVENVPLYTRRLHTLASVSGQPWVRKIIGEGLAEAQRSVGNLTTLASEWIGTFLRSLWSGGRALFSIFSFAIVTPIVASYFLYGWKNMIASIDNWAPPSRREIVRGLALEIDDRVLGFVRGQATLCVILAMLYGVALWLIGLKHGALIGFASGIMSFVPYLGSLLGLTVSTCIAIAQFWPNWTLIALVPLVFFVGQSLADYAFALYLIGGRVHLNPVWMIFALFAFGYFLGFIGLLIAVPAAAALGVLVRFALRQYYASPLYASAFEDSSPSADRLPTPERTREIGEPSNFSDS